MIEFYNSPIYWAWSLFLSASWLAQGAFIAPKPVNYILRLWWIIFLNGFLLTASHILLSCKSISEGSYSDGFLYGSLTPVVLVALTAFVFILQVFISPKTQDN